jgi:hypothetical protein
MDAIDVARRQRRPDRALVHVDALIAASRVASRWRVLRAELLDETGRASEATAERRRALLEAERLVARRGAPIAFLERGRARLALGDRRGAREDLDRALRRAPQLVEARRLLAEASQ